MSLRSYLIHKLGGATREEFRRLDESFNRCVEWMKAQDRVTILQSVQLTNAKFTEPVVVAPWSGSSIISPYIEAPPNRPGLVVYDELAHSPPTDWVWRSGPAQAS